MKALALLLIMFVSIPYDAEQNQKGISLYLKPRAVLKSGEVRASDILNWKSNTDPILYSDLKSPMVVSAIEIAERLLEVTKKSGGDDATYEIGGTTSNIVPLTSVWGKEKLENFLRNELGKNIYFTPENFKIYYEGPGVALPEKNVTFVWRKFGQNIHGGKRIFPLDVMYEDKLIYSTPVSFIIEEKKEAWFTKRNIEPKEILQSYDIEKRSFFTSDHNTEYDLENPVGKTALNAIPEGMPLQRKQTRRLHLVERGSEVSLIYTSGNIMVKVRTRALVSGNEGEMIDLLNLSSNKKLKGKIQSAGICLLGGV
ncbi:flagellar basal body P-ring formation protein FlgA [Leptospira ognonensis]|uniref:Flagellar basal body P-ring formation protein FlgA n=1 Tax=Leptospira ognonensis TaxID=2484945 RepID=A0A4V6QM83_9LEPT|nr:flagellar basal body P-ring formation chaperone FlgA [Leptospira ognonensis]TGL62699.1 flagellar basal body P-ring formation protein FlgA [Leptospira ognonensis]